MKSMNLHDKKRFWGDGGRRQKEDTCGGGRTLALVVCMCALKIKKMAGIGITTYIMCFVISRNGIR